MGLSAGASVCGGLGVSESGDLHVARRSCARARVPLPRTPERAAGGAWAAAAGRCGPSRPGPPPAPAPVRTAGSCPAPPGRGTSRGGGSGSLQPGSARLPYHGPSTGRSPAEPTVPTTAACVKRTSLLLHRTRRAHDLSTDVVALHFERRQTATIDV
jgi:hypothetical protein